MIGFMLLVALAATAAEAAEPAGRARFNGAWLVDLASRTGSETEWIRVEGRQFARSDGGSEIRVPADGEPHSVKDDGYVDSIAVSVPSPTRIVETDRYKGVVRYVVDYAVSADGTTLTRTVTDHGKPNGTPITTRIVQNRVGPRAAAGSAISGQWRTAELARPKEQLIQHFRIADDVLTSSFASGYGYTAIIGGDGVVVRGETDRGRARVAMPDADTIIEDRYYDGQHTIRMTMTMLSDGNTIRVATRRTRDGHSAGWLLHRQ